MKSNELMAGDWVQCEGCTSPSRVAGVTPGKIHTWWADGSKHSKDENYFKPVPLTEEVMEKNGFVKYEHARNKWVYEDLKGRTEIDYWKSGGERDAVMDITRNVYTDDEVTYELPEPYSVHDLQHALRLCGLTKLADNFKID